MPEKVELHGYRFSVYTRIVRMVLQLKAVAFQDIETNPFGDLPESYAELHPFGRVPVLRHGSFTLYETSAITRYADRAFAGPQLQPDCAAALARMDQVIAMVDAYCYVPMVRQVFSHWVFRPLAGEPASEDLISQGLLASRQALAALENVAAEGRVLTGEKLTLADCHLAPIIGYFAMAREGQQMLAEFPALQHWWLLVSQTDAVRGTEPDLTLLAPRQP